MNKDTAFLFSLDLGEIVVLEGCLSVREHAEEYRKFIAGKVIPHVDSMINYATLKESYEVTDFDYEKVRCYSMKVDTTFVHKHVVLTVFNDRGIGAYLDVTTIFSGTDSSSIGLNSIERLQILFVFRELIVNKIT